MARCPMTTSRFDLDRLAAPPLLELARQSLAIRLTERTQLSLIENPRRVLDHLDSILADEPFWDHFQNDSNRGVEPILESLGVLRISSDTRVLCESGVEPVLRFTLFVNVAAILDGDRLPGSEGRARARNYDRDLRIAPDGRDALAMAHAGIQLTSPKFRTAAHNASADNSNSPSVLHSAISFFTRPSGRSFRGMESAISHTPQFWGFETLGLFFLGGSRPAGFTGILWIWTLWLWQSW